MVKSFPFMIQPKISFSNAQVPSPFSIFFSEIGSPPQCFDIAVGGNMLCIPCSIALDS